jgi:hypothetical protein
MCTAELKSTQACIVLASSRASAVASFVLDDRESSTVLDMLSWPPSHGFQHVCTLYSPLHPREAGLEDGKGVMTSYVKERFGRTYGTSLSCTDTDD